MQLSLFNNQLKWENINNEWLFNYLQSNYPKYKFKIFDGFSNIEKEIKSTKDKKVELRFYITETENLNIWKNPILISLSVAKTYGDYSGQSEAVNNFDDFYNRLKVYLEKYDKFINENLRKNE